MFYHCVWLTSKPLFPGLRAGIAASQLRGTRVCAAWRWLVYPKSSMVNTKHILNQTKIRLNQTKSDWTCGSFWTFKFDYGPYRGFPNKSSKVCYYQRENRWFGVIKFCEFAAKASGVSRFDPTNLWASPMKCQNECQKTCQNLYQSRCQVCPNICLIVNVRWKLSEYLPQ